MNESTIEFLKWLLSAALGTGWIGTLMYYRPNKKKAKVEANKEELKYYISQIDHLKKQNKEVYETIEKLQEIIDELRAKNIEDVKKINNLELKLVEAEKRKNMAEYNECVVDNCCDRVPKRETDLCKKTQREMKDETL